MPTPTGPGQFTRVDSNWYQSRQVGASGKYVWDAMTSATRMEEGGVLRIAASGTVTQYHPATPDSQANFAALRDALAAAATGDVIVPDPVATYEYDGTPLAMLNLSNVKLSPAKVTRPIGTTYTRIMTVSGCTDCMIDGFNFDGRSVIQWPQTYPLNTLKTNVTNPNDVSGVPTYVIEVLNACERVEIKNASIKNHSGTVVVSSAGFNWMPGVFGIDITTTCKDIHVTDCTFADCGYSGLSTGANGTVASGCTFNNCGWHAMRWDGGAGTNLLVDRCTFTESTPRLGGYKSDFDANSSTVCDQVLCRNCTFRHEYDWLDDMLQWDVSTSYIAGDHVFNASEIYEAIGSGTGGAGPTGKADVGNWRWLMPYTSCWSAKFGNVGTVVIDNCKMIHGKNGDRSGIRASIKIEDTVDELRIQNNSYLSGQLMAVSSLVKNTDVYITDSEINATAEASFASRIDKVGQLVVSKSQINYDFRAFSVSGGGASNVFSKGIHIEDSKFIPWQVNFTTSEIIEEIDVVDIPHNIHFTNNVIVDRTTGTEYVEGFGNHITGDGEDLRLWMTGTSVDKAWDSTLSGVFAHPTVTAGGSLSVGLGYATKDVRVRNLGWSGLGDTLSWSYDGGSLWEPETPRARHMTTGAGIAEPDVTFATSCETPGTGVTITDFVWSVPIPTGWIMWVSVRTGDTLDASTPPGMDFGEFGVGPTDPWTPVSGGSACFRYNGTNWVLLAFNE